MAVITDLGINISANDTDLKKGLLEAANKISDFAHTAIKSTEVAALAITASIGGAFYGLVKIINETSDRIDDLAKTSVSLGIGVEPLQRLQYAAEQSNISVESLTNGLDKLLKNTEKAAEGDKTLVDTFNRLGLSAQSLKDKGIDQEYIDIANAIQKIKSPAEQALIATNLFGRAGVEQLALLKEDVGSLVDEFDNLGITLSGEQTASIKQYGDEVRKLGVIWGGFKAELTGALAGPLTEFLKWIEESIQNFGGLKSIAESVASSIVSSFQKVISVFKETYDIVTKIRIAAAEINLKTDQKTLLDLKQNNIADAVANGGSAKVSQPVLAAELKVKEDEKFISELRETLGNSPLQKELANLASRIQAVAPGNAGSGTINGVPIDTSTKSSFTINGKNMLDNQQNGTMTISGANIDVTAPQSFTINGKNMLDDNSPSMSVNGQKVQLDITVNAGSGLTADVVNSAANQNVILNVVTSAIQAASRGEQ